MKLAQLMAAQGMLNAEPLSQEVHAELAKMLETQPGLKDWRDGKELTIVTRGSTFFIYDFDGFLCSTSSIECLMILLLLSASEAGARVKLGLVTQLNPAAPQSSLDATFHDLAALQARAASLRDKAIERGSAPRGTAGSGDEVNFTPEEARVVRSIGLEDGPPKF